MKRTAIMISFLVMLLSLAQSILSFPEEKALFDISITVPEQYQKAAAGDEVLASIQLVNLGGEGRIDVYLDYWITDKDELTIAKRQETIAVETQANFIRSFTLNKNLPPGKYTFYAQISYANGKKAEAHHSFDIVKQEEPAANPIVKKSYLQFLPFILLALAFFIMKMGNFFRIIALRIKIWCIVRKRVSS